MKKIALLFFILPLYLFAGKNEAGWNSSGESQKRFIENKSQFDGRDRSPDSKILYAVDQNGTQIYFTKEGLTYRFDKKEKKYKEENEREEKINSAEEYMEYEKKEREMITTTDFVHMQWANANPDVEVIAEEKTDDYFSYTKVNGENINYIKGYKKLIYKNLYPNIDVEYIFPEGKEGIKYSLILHPGADASQIKMLYSNPSLRAERSNLSLDKEGNIHIPTLFGDIIDHAPFTFYSDNKKEITSSFALVNDVVTFSLPLGKGQGWASSTIVIDPWTQTPTLPNSNGVWECERDGAGNVYIIGGDSPMKLLKYNSAGAIQWTYSTPYDTANNWLGTFATDLLGNSYVTSGSIAAMQKVNTSAGLVWNYTAPIFSVDEYWTISFNCDQTMLVVGGTTGPGFPSTNLQGAIFNINTTNGNIIGTPQIVGSMFNTIPPYINEVRTLTASKNARYYYLTLDTIGCIDQNFVCSANPIFEVSSGYNLSYKCENYRTISSNGGNAGIKTIRANGNFVYTQNGTNVQKRSLATGAVITTVAIPGGASTSSLGRNAISNGGIDIDTCGNVYVGSCNAVIKYDANLNLLSQVALSFNVYDVAVSTNGDVIVCGATGIYSTVSRTGYVQSIASFAACNPISLQCCNANICPPDPFCSTDPPLTLTASQSGGTWSGTGITNPSTGLFDPSVSGTGTFTITYTLPCGSGSMTVVVNNCALPTVCLEANGDLTVSGGAGPAYQWQVQGTANDCSQCFFPALCQPPAPNCPLIVTTWTTYSNNATATPPGTWPIQVIDGSGNILVINSLSGIPACSPVSATIAFTPPVCNGQCNGTATVTQTGGTLPITYSWNTVPAQTTPTATGLCAGSYSVLVTDAAANTTTANVLVTQPAAIAATTTVTSASCGSSNGSATVNASNGTSPYTYSWNPSTQTTATATGLTAGSYTVTVTDVNGCTQIATALVTTTPGLAATMASTDPLCNGGSNGFASATPTGGTSPYTFSWSTSPAQTSSSATGLSAGTYTVLITDAAGCIGTQTVTLFQPTAITSSVSTTNTTCGASTGSAAVTASGGTGGLTYSWNPGGQTTPSISNLAAGTYSCTVTDANGCTQTSNGTVANANGPTATILSQVNVTCSGGTNGSANSSATGGTAPYTYSWNTTPPQTTANATGLSAGNYVVTVTDASGCSNTQTVAITAPAALSASVTNTPATCGLIPPDGSATAAATGGTSPYTYTWSNFQSTQTITGLAAGSYSVLITDASGCSQTFTTIVTISNGPTATATASPATITQGSSSTLTASGGITYLWNTGATTSTISVSPTVTTSYTLVVTDANYCTDTTVVTVSVEPPSVPCGNKYYFPNAFSPNGDNVIGNDGNDVLQIYPPEIVPCIKEFKLVIYDRWGEKVFETENPAEPWNGIPLRKGKTMDTQVLAYYLHIVFIDGTAVDKQGNVSLVR
ncbi:MAG: gliding motility-associated C-terminal domain-containing protein [Bacteroidetes bacterium]|nr:gliding motility-associated C-terminal domain-containing protein [Bacteroidota bacterium]